MRIIIHSTEDTIEYRITNHKGASNDQICRAITHLELIKKELLALLKYDYQIFEEDT